MAEKSKVIRDWSGILLILLLLFLAGCANQVPPGGGAVDTTPPEIVSVYPENGTINFSDDHIEIDFSEYVDKPSFQASLFISPTPEGQPEFDWSGHSVRVNFFEKLNPEITYVVTVGTDLVDLNNRNHMAQSYTFSFSTGNQIDRGIVEGKVFSKAPAGTMIFAYSLDSANINPSKNKPKYVSQTGKKGEYRLSGLAYGGYRIFAVKDEFKDFLYDIGSDSYGVPFSDITLNLRDSLFAGLDFQLTTEDTAKPRLLSAAMTDRYHILTGFSEAVDSTLYRNENFFIIDSTTNKVYDPAFVFLGRGKRTEMVIALKDVLSDQNNVFLVAKSLKDLSGNETRDDYTRITVTAKPDTSAPVMIKSIPPHRDMQVPTAMPEISFFFDDGFDTLLINDKTVSVTDRGGNKYPFQTRFYDAASFYVKILADLKPKTDYYISLNFKGIKDAAGNRADSLYKYAFTTFTGTDYSGVSGQVAVKATDSSDTYVVLQNTENEKHTYKQKTGKKNQYNFDRVEPGKYIIWSFKSRDKSGNYNYGKTFPFKPSDRFIVSPDTLNLRARWPVSDVNLSY